jgi:hypothetical protein
MWNRGKLVIVGILGVAVIAAGFSVWYHYRNQQRALKFWGPTTAMLIAEAPHAHAIVLDQALGGTSADDAGSQAPAEPQAGDAPREPPASIEFAGITWKGLHSKNVVPARGISNVRRALVLDMTYDWKSPPPLDDPQWQYALEFNNGRYWATVLFDFDSRQVALTNGKKTALLDPDANEELRDFFAEQFPDEPAAAMDEAAEKSNDDSGDKPAVPGANPPPVQPSAPPDEPRSPSERPADKPGDASAAGAAPEK